MRLARSAKCNGASAGRANWPISRQILRTATAASGIGIGLSGNSASWNRSSPKNSRCLIPPVFVTVTPTRIEAISLAEGVLQLDPVGLPDPRFDVPESSDDFQALRRRLQRERVNTLSN